MVWRFAAARLAASPLALAIPTIAMGATYPSTTRALAPERTQNLISAALATQGHVDAARAAFARSIAADPRDSGTYVNAGSLELEHGRPDDARRQFAIALAMDLTSAAARRGLAAAREALGRP